MERFWAKVMKQSGDGHWIWTGAKTPDGYGHFWSDGRAVPAHRWSYEALVGPIADGLEIDHLCRIRACVRPKHLEPVTRCVNILRGIGTPAKNARKSHCIAGHPLSGENLLHRPGRKRDCRECQRRRNAARIR